MLKMIRCPKVACSLVFSALLLPVAGANATVIVSSSVSMDAKADAGNGAVTDSQSAGQGASLNPLSASATAVALDDLGLAMVTTRGAVAATWASANQGQVVFQDIGWETHNVYNGSADLFGSAPNWSYSFIAQANGTFTLNYNIALDAATTEDFGLNGFWFIAPTGSSTPLTDWAIGAFPISGSLSYSIFGGQSYTATLANGSNIAGGLVDRVALMDATFDWKITTVPEPGTLALLGLGALGLVRSRRRWN